MQDISLLVTLRLASSDHEALTAAWGKETKLLCLEVHYWQKVVA